MLKVLCTETYVISRVILEAFDETAKLAADFDAAGSGARATCADGLASVAVDIAVDVLKLYTERVVSVPGDQPEPNTAGCRDLNRFTVLGDSQHTVVVGEEF